MSFALAELSRRFNNIVRLGTIAEINADNTQLRVQTGDIIHFNDGSVIETAFFIIYLSLVKTAFFIICRSLVKTAFFILIVQLAP